MDFCLHDLSMRFNLQWEVKEFILVVTLSIKEQNVNGHCKERASWSSKKRWQTSLEHVIDLKSSMTEHLPIVTSYVVNAGIEELFL